MPPPAISIRDFNYSLPDSAVAKYPLAARDHSKLLVWKEKGITDHIFSDLPGLLPESAMLVFNNTRVIRARLHFTKPTGAGIEIFCLEPSLPHDHLLSFAQTSSCRWKCIVGNKKRWKEGVLEMHLQMGRGDEKASGRLGSWEAGKMRGEGKLLPDVSQVLLSAEMLDELESGFEINFSWNNPKYNFADILEAAGDIPIPPYLHRASEEIDETVYQTVYSKVKGSVAAPTAGLHFTDKVFSDLAACDIKCEEITLHVGAGTFQPVKSETVGAHSMHTEYFSVGCATINRLIHQSGRVIAVGTTSVRTLESLYWIGCEIIGNPEIEPDQVSVTQWAAYREIECKIEAKEALQAILKWLSDRRLSTLESSTQIMILPGYQFRIIGGLVTNFHQPQSTLLLLISAILGEDWKRVYAHALENGYRFLSYGDANLYLLRQNVGANIKNADL